MKVWTAHLRPGKAPILLRDGFSIPAMVFGPFWLLAQRAWIAGAIGLAAMLVVKFLLPDTIGAVAELLLTVAFGLFGHDLMVWTLDLKGYLLAEVVVARTHEDAFARLLSARPDLATEAAL